MVTIVEPRQYISKLWGKQCVNVNLTYRLMKYIIQVKDNNRILLHNNVTGQLVLLNQEETQLLEKLPMPYVSVMDKLVKDHFLVAEDYDEHNLVLNLRKILTKLETIQKPKGFTSYTILPTTACNARCYYCFEHYLEPFNMTEQTAYDIVEFIDTTRRKDKTISITWFGGEPTIAVDRIDQICIELSQRGIKFSSEMISNGYLFNEEMVNKAKTIWNLTSIQISVDGVEDNYNKIKAFVNVKDNPYQRVMRNVGLLLEKEIHVGLRMNFDLGNYQDFIELLKEAKISFGLNPYLQIAAYPVIGEYTDKNGITCHGDDTWITEKIVSLNNQARETGLRWYDKGLPELDFRGCGAANDSYIVINASGALVRCLEQLSADQNIGDVINGITNEVLSSEWKKVCDFEKCINCNFFPNCVKLVNCSAGDRCYQQDRNQQYIFAIENKYDFFRRENSHVF